jgi:two-component system, OmpR family, alkaline phosphatase synthesis response regulator PhoP
MLKVAWSPASGGESKTMDKPKVLIVDDEAALVELLREWLEKGEYEVFSAPDGLSGLREFFKHQPDLSIIDVAMPGLNGFELSQRIREVSQTPIIILTAKGQELDKVRGLNLGADEYLVKPVGRQELLARVGALLRRVNMMPPETAGNYSDSVIRIDFAKHEVFVRDNKIELTPTEFRLLAYLVQHPDQVLTLQQIWDRIWGWSGGSLENVKWHIAYLRKKIEENPEKPELVITIRGVGYRYQKPQP